MKSLGKLEESNSVFVFIPPAIHWPNGNEGSEAGANTSSKHLLYLDIEEIPSFNAKIVNALHFIGVNKVHELMSLQKRDLQKAEGIGTKAISVILDFLIEHELLSAELAQSQSRIVGRIGGSRSF